VTPQELKNSILQLAIQGKLVEQRPEEGTGEELYQQIQKEKQELIKAGKIKKEKPLPEITEEEKPFDIPETWKWVPIGKAFNLQAGKNITSSDIHDEISSQYPYQCFGGNGCRGYVSNYNRSGHFAIIGRQGALCGNINYAEGLFYATEHAVVVEQFAGTDVHWCGYFLKSLNLNQYATATAQPGLAVANINQVLIPLPPLAEQKRIVAKIEELLPLIDRYEKAWNRLEEFNKRFPDALQKSLLQMAIQGKLVEQRAEEGTGEELYLQIQKEKQKLIREGKIKREKSLPEITEEEKPFDIPDSWKWVHWGDLINVVSARRVHQADWKSHGIPFYRAREIATLSEEGHVDNELYISKELYDELSKSGVPQVNDLMVTAVGTLGKTYIVKKDDCFYYKDASVICLENYCNLNPFFLRFVLQSEMMKNQIRSNSSGTTVATLTIVRMNEYICLLPPLAEQHRIVAKLEELLPLCDKLKG